MKKRIFAASMASVMALSSVSVVAFADETKDFGETVTKAELKEAIKAYDEKLKNIDTYGSVQALRFQEAYDHAAYVAADAKADADDATAAYQMLKAVAVTLKQYTNEELKELIADCKATYDENNILNDEIRDNVYEEDAFLTFKNAYEDAESIVEVDDLMIVTDAYIKLDEAATALEGKKLTPVTKTQFRAIIKDYEKVLAQFSKNEGWRRGKVSVNPTTGNAKNSTGADLDLTTAVYVTWGELQNIVNGTSDDKVVTEVIKGKVDAKMDLTESTWIAVGGKGKTVEELIYEKSEVFDNYKAASKTTDPTIKGAYDAAKEAISVFNSWKAIDADSTVKSQATKTLNNYRTQLVKDFEEILAKSLEKITFKDGEGKDVAALKYENGKLVGQPGAAKAGCVLRIVSATGLIQLDKDDAYEPDAVEGKKSYTIKIAEGEDYLKYIPVRSKSIKPDAQSNYAADKVNAAKAALKMLEDYNKVSDMGSKATADNWKGAYGEVNADGSKDDLADLDENKTVTKPAGSSREYTLINRYLAYALQDLYPEEAAACSHTKADIKKVIEEAYDLINKTGDCNIFATANAELAEARKAAVEWVREAEKDKKYKDNDNDHGKFTVTGVLTDANANTVYHTLKCAADAKYDALDAKLKEYPISYAEIAEKIVKVNADVEDGVYGEAVKKAVDDVAYALSVLKVSEIGNEAFTDERAFNGYNRLRVNDDATTVEEKDLKAALDTLDTALKDATQGGDVVIGDLDGDGKPTAKDALLVLKAAAGETTLTDAQKKAADFNDDGVFNAKDALAILKAFAGA